MIPLLFGICAAVLTMVGVNIGAGQLARARQIAWISSLVGAGVAGGIGLVVAIFPMLWLRLFSHDPTCWPPARPIFGSSCRLERKKIEMRFSHLKRISGAWSASTAGPAGAQDEFTLAAIAQNLRRFATLVVQPLPHAVQCIAWRVCCPRALGSNGGAQPPNRQWRGGGSGNPAKFPLPRVRPSLLGFGATLDAPRRIWSLHPAAKAPIVVW